MNMSRSAKSIRLQGRVGDEERIFDLGPGRHLVGRSPNSTLYLPSANISRRHAVLQLDGSRLTIEDLGSTNGSYVDEQRVDKRARAGAGAVLGFGSIRLRVRSLSREESRLAIELPQRQPPALPASFMTTTIQSSFGLSISNALETSPPGLSFPVAYQPGRSSAMVDVYRQLAAVAKGPIPILLRGETGAGKEMIARILHLSSPRWQAPFVAINCSAIPADLLEAELFGIGKAVATGVAPRPGLFLSASGGTLLLDEVGEMLLPLQAKLLRVLQEKEVRPVGGTTRQLDVRILSATNVDLQAAIANGRFREDLYFRLAGDVLELPPLRHCVDDIPVLAKHFLEKYSQEVDVRPRGLSVETLRLLSAYAWPGNIRELENEIRRLVYRANDGQIIDSSLLSAPIRSFDIGDARRGDDDVPTKQVTLAERVQAFEAEIIAETLRKFDGNRTHTAEALCLSRNGLLKKMKRLGMTDEPRET